MSCLCFDNSMHFDGNILTESAANAYISNFECLKSFPLKSLNNTDTASVCYKLRKFVVIKFEFIHSNKVFFSSDFRKNVNAPIHIHVKIIKLNGCSSKTKAENPIWFQFKISTTTTKRTVHLLLAKFYSLNFLLSRNLHEALFFERILGFVIVCFFGAA